MVEVFRYRRQDGVEPFTEWLSSIRDKIAQARIRIRLRQIEALGDCKPVGEDVIKLRVHVGAGYHGKSIVILLCGGDKSSQTKDIKKTKELWAEWKQRQK
jgi:putative addiction module killer protein